QLRGPDGTIVNPSPDQQSTETLPLDPSALDALQNGNSIEPYVVTVGGQQLLLYDTDITFGDRLVGILQVAQPLQVAERRLDTVRRVLLGGGAIATLLAFGIGSLLARPAL